MSPDDKYPSFANLAWYFLAHQKTHIESIHAAFVHTYSELTQSQKDNIQIARKVEKTQKDLHSTQALLLKVKDEGEKKEAALRLEVEKAEEQAKEVEEQAKAKAAMTTDPDSADMRERLSVMEQYIRQQLLVNEQQTLVNQQQALVNQQQAERIVELEGTVQELEDVTQNADDKATLALAFFTEQVGLNPLLLPCIADRDQYNL